MASDEDRQGDGSGWVNSQKLIRCPRAAMPTSRHLRWHHFAVRFPTREVGAC